MPDCGCRIDGGRIAPVVHGGCPSGTWSVSQWYTVGVPVVHGGCPSGTRSMSQWDTVRTPLGHGTYPTGTRCVPHWDTVRTPLGHSTYPTGTRSVYQWDMVCVPMGHGECPVVYGGCPVVSGRVLRVTRCGHLSAALRTADDKPFARTSSLWSAQGGPSCTGNLTVRAANYAPPVRPSSYPADHLLRSA